ncbi:MAG TPA: helix-turn-helix domain-containing protein [Blastocatellia bacterium]|nr:helix-turn-helix domain-containing protein [Blastocatellia bacterium]
MPEEIHGKRVAPVKTRHRKDTSGEIRLRLPLKRKEIARMINISPHYVSELLTELVEEGVLRRNGRELIIVDQSGLWHEIDFEELILNH